VLIFQYWNPAKLENSLSLKAIENLIPFYFTRAPALFAERAFLAYLLRKSGVFSGRKCSERAILDYDYTL
jgi:hypothetical protein